MAAAEERKTEMAGDYADGTISRREWMTARDRLDERIDAATKILAADTGPLAGLPTTKKALTELWDAATGRLAPGGDRDRRRPHRVRPPSVLAPASTRAVCGSTGRPHPALVGELWWRCQRGGVRWWPGLRPVSAEHAGTPAVHEHEPELEVPEHEPELEVHIRFVAEEVPGGSPLRLGAVARARKIAGLTRGRRR